MVTLVFIKNHKFLPKDPSKTGPNSGQFGTITATLSPGAKQLSNKCDPNFLVKEMLLRR